MRPSTDTLDIGLINNMPDTALEATERQFSQLLSSAADSLTVRLVFFALPEIERGASARERIERLYAPLSALWNGRFDALIVTGAEPRAAELPQEPYWGRLVELMEWAGTHTHSTIWSCLAAHAAVLHLDAIARRRLPFKCCGVFEHQLGAHWLTQGLPVPLSIPHSRWNDIPRADLERRGYEVLAAAPLAGVNLFCKHHARSLFLFWQGHPEYDQRSLLKEYQRDVGRFLRSESDTYPTMPYGYFDAGKHRRAAGVRARGVGPVARTATAA